MTNNLWCKDNDHEVNKHCEMEGSRSSSMSSGVNVEVAPPMLYCELQSTIEILSGNTKSKLELEHN